MTCRFWLLAAAMTALMVSGCARPTKVESAWAPGAAAGQRFGNFLVVGVTPNYTIRCRYERMLVDSLVTVGVRATTSCSRMTSEDLLTREAIVAAISDLDVDAVLSTRLVDGRVQVEEGGRDEARGEAYYKPIGYGYDNYYGAFGLPVTYVDFVAEQPSLTIERTVVLSSNLYETRGATLVYTLDTVAYDKTSAFEVIDAVTTALAERLQRDGLLAPRSGK